MRLEDIPFEETMAPEPAGPGWRSLMTGGEARRRFARYWIRDPLQGGVDRVAHALFRLLPVRTCSRLGATLAPLAERAQAKRPFAQRLTVLVATLRPDIASDPARLKETASGWWRNTARSFAEYSVIDRLRASPRVEIRGEEHYARAIAQGRRVVFASVHLANWELLFNTLHARFPKPLAIVFQPEPNRFVNRIVYRMRRRCGFYAFPPGPRTAHRLMRLLTGGSTNILFFVDEVRACQIHFPLFGRQSPERGNAVNAVKAAAAADALLLPIYMQRRSDDFVLTILPPLELARDALGKCDVAASIHGLNAVFEPIVRARLEEWYMLCELKLPRTEDPSGAAKMPMHAAAAGEG